MSRKPKVFRLSRQEVQEYGFEWGPMDIVRAAHIEGRGYVLDITTDHVKVEIHITEQGRRAHAIVHGSGEAKVMKR